MRQIELDTRRAATRGITLLELVIAVFVLSVGTIAALRSIDHAQRNIGGEASRLFATQVALNRAEELRLFGPVDGQALPPKVAYGPYEWDIELTQQSTRGGFIETTVTSGAEGQPGGRVVVITPAQAE